LRIQRIEDTDRALQRIDAAFGNGRMGLPAMNRDFHLQAAVVRGDHLVAKARGDHQVGLGELVSEQPARPQLAAKLLVVGEVQLNNAAERGAQRLERAHRKGEGGEIAFVHCRRAAIEFAVPDLAAIGVLGPSFARRHGVAMRVQGNGFALTVVAAHDQVGDRL